MRMEPSNYVIKYPLWSWKRWARFFHALFHDHLPIRQAWICGRFEIMPAYELKKD